MRVPFHSYQRNVEDGRLVNVFAEANPPGNAKGPLTLLRSAGISAHAAPTAGPGRGLHVMNGRLYAVTGTGLYDVTAGATLKGTIPGTARVRMADNGTLLCIVTKPGEGYTFDGTTVAQITDTDFTSRRAGGVVFIDGYFVFNEPETGRFFQSDLYSAAFDPLKFATAEGMPDNVVDLIEDHRQLVLGGTKSVELWWNSGADNFVFDRLPDGFVEIGCRGAIAKSDNSVFWVANENTARRLSGSTPVRVSTHAVEEAFRGYTSVPYGFTYTIDGHLFWIVQFPEEATWAFDITTGEWAERESGNGDPWSINAAAELGSVQYVQDAITGAVGTVQPEVYTEFGATQRCVWRYPSIYDGGRELFHNRFELVCHVGLGADPQIMLEYSDDGGKTWTSAPNRTLGAIGQYKTRVTWHGLGSAVDRVYQCSTSDPAVIKITDTLVDVEKGEV